MELKKIYLLLSLLLFFTPAKSETEFSFYAGTFDTIDKEGDDEATLYGFEHNNPILFRDTFIGKFSPITGGFVTDKSSIYLYTGVQAEYELGPLNIVPSFAPGYYEQGDGKDLGHILEFKSEVQLSYAVSDKTSFGASYNHVSNASLGDKNPGANSYMFNLLKNF